MLEHDIIAVQKRISELSSSPPHLPPPVSPLPSRHFSERELQALREGGSSGKLALHEILSEKLISLERAALHACGGLGELPSSSLSRLPSLLALVDRLASLHLKATRAKPPSSQVLTTSPSDPSTTPSHSQQKREAEAGNGGEGEGQEICELRRRAEEAEGLREEAERCLAIREDEHAMAMVTVEEEVEAHRSELIKLRAQLSAARAAAAAGGGGLEGGDAAALSEQARVDATALAELAESEAQSQMEVGSPFPPITPLLSLLPLLSHSLSNSPLPLLLLLSSPNLPVIASSRILSSILILFHFSCSPLSVELHLPSERSRPLPRPPIPPPIHALWLQAAALARTRSESLAARLQEMSERLSLAEHKAERAEELEEVTTPSPSPPQSPQSTPSAPSHSVSP